MSILSSVLSGVKLIKILISRCFFSRTTSTLDSYVTLKDIFPAVERDVIQNKVQGQGQTLQSACQQTSSLS